MALLPAQNMLQCHTLLVDCAKPSCSQAEQLQLQ
jgi:hypothetical protein